jgi:stage II sporulation protein D
MMRLTLLTLALAALVPASAQAADVVVDGRGWGHGVGMSQYGAYGYALREGRDAQFILSHYYTGSAYGTAPGARMRVRLKKQRAPRISGATLAKSASGRRVRLDDAHVYRFKALNATRIQIINTFNGKTKARVPAPVTVTGGTSTTLRGTGENGLANGAYRGRMVLSRDGGGVLVVNSVGLEQYLYGVVPSEMPASWPAEALKAQAVVARSYALKSRRPTEPYDVFADVRSQVYRGVLAETTASNTAVKATRARVVTVGGEIAQTFFFSTSGGRTATNEEAFGGSPISYLRSVDDPYDDLSPYHTWTARFTAAQARKKLKSVTLGRLTGLKVASRTVSGRASTVTVQGSGGDSTVSAATVRTLLGLRSTWITRFAGP